MIPKTGGSMISENHNRNPMVEYYPEAAFYSNRRVRGVRGVCKEGSDLKHLSSFL